MPFKPKFSFSNQSTDNDIALLKLETELEFNERVQPACLPYGGPYASLGMESFNEAFASGWGINEPGGELIREGVTF